MYAMDIDLENDDYISNRLTEDVYCQWTIGAKVFISGSTNSGKTKFAVNYATDMYNKYGWETLYITSRGLVRRQLYHEYGASTHEFIDFMSYHNLFKSLDEIRKKHDYPFEQNVTDRKIIIVDESLTFFDDVFISGAGDKADLLLNFLLNYCEDSIIIFMSSLGYYLESYIDRFFNGDKPNPAYPKPIYPIVYSQHNPINPFIYRFIKPVNYLNYYSINDKYIDDLLENLPDGEKVIYFCSETESESIYKTLLEKEYDRIIEKLEQNGNFSNRGLLKKEARKLADQNISMVNSKRYTAYREDLKNQCDVAGVKYYDLFNTLIVSKNFTARILVAGDSVCTSLSIEDLSIKHVIINLYNQKHMYIMMGRLKSASNNVAVYFRFRLFETSHMNRLQKQKEMIDYLTSSNDLTVYRMAEECSVEDLQGLVRIAPEVTPSPDYDFCESGIKDHNMERADSKRIPFKPIYVAHHKVYLDNEYVDMMKKKSLLQVLQAYQILPLNIQVIPEYGSETRLASLDWLRENVIPLAQDKAYLFVDDDMIEQIRNHTANASGEKPRKRPSETSKDLQAMDIQVKIKCNRRDDGKDQKGKRIQKSVWTFSIVEGKDEDTEE